MHRPGDSMRTTDDAAIPGSVTKPIPRAQRIELIGRIKEAIQQNKSWEHAGDLLAELEG